MVQKVLGSCAAKNGTKWMNRRKTWKMDTKTMEACEKRIFNSRRREDSCKECERGCKVEGRKKKGHRKECTRLREEFEVGGFMAQKGPWNIAKRRMLEDRGALPRRRRLREYQAMHEE